jgi:hypothetical protein
METAIMKIQKYLILSTLLCGILMADIPGNWEINPADYENYMTVTAVLDVNNVPSASDNIVLGAFVGDECRGYTYPIMVGEQWMYFLMIYADTNNELINFKVYDIDNEILTYASDVITFASGIPNGTPDDPFLFSVDTSTIVSGDINFDADVNVLDIVIMVDIILAGDTWVDNEGNYLTEDQFTAGDINGDGNLNVLDIVQLVEILLWGDLSRTVVWYFTDDEWKLDEVWGGIVTTASLLYSSNYIGIRSDGDIAGIQFEVSGDFNIKNNKLPNGWEFHHNDGIILIYSLDGSKLTSSKLFEYSGEINITKTVVADWYGSDIVVSSMQVPDRYILGKVYPNPFNPVTNVSFTLPEDSHVSVEIFNLKGQLIDSIYNGFRNAGEYHFIWNAEGIVSGTYFLKMDAGSYQDVQKIVLMK